jgi:cytochrome bd-type quinol oxidase subunit 1
MLSTLKGRLSAYLLATKSNHTVSRASLYFALYLALLMALLSALFAFAQWRVGEHLAKIQQVRARAVEVRIATSANMASQQANAHRATLNVLLSRDRKEFHEAEGLRCSNLQGYLESSRLLGDNAGLHEAAEDLQMLTAQYEEISAQVVDLFREGQREAALDLRALRLREAFNRWQQAHAGFSTKLAQTELEQKKDYKEATASARRWLASLLIAPVALVMLGIMAIAAVFGLQRFGAKTPDTWSR